MNSIFYLFGFGLDLGFLFKSESGDDVYFFIFLGEFLDSWRVCMFINCEVCMISVVEKLMNEKEWWIKCVDVEICEGWEQELFGINWFDVMGFFYVEFILGMFYVVCNFFF